MQFSFFVENYWFPFCVDDGTRKPTTIQFYKNTYPRIGEFFGEMEIESIKPLDIETFLRNIRFTENISSCTVRHLYSTLRNILLAAQKYEVISRNPMEFVKKPPLEKEPIKAVTKTNAHEFFIYLSQIKKLFDKTVMMTLVTTGLRRGELCGITWRDVDFNRLTIYIHRNVTYSPTTGNIVGSPKTKSSIRKVTMPPATAALLLQLRRANEQYVPSGMTDDDCFVFHAHESNHHDVTKPASPNAISRMVTRHMKKAGFVNMSAHSLRHTCATLLLANGSNIKIVQTMLGHADAAVTLNFYATVDMNDLYDATQAFSRTFLEWQTDESNFDDLQILPEKPNIALLSEYSRGR